MAKSTKSKSSEKAKVQDAEIVEDQVEAAAKSVEASDEITIDAALEQELDAEADSAATNEAAPIDSDVMSETADATTEDSLVQDKAPDAADAMDTVDTADAVDKADAAPEEPLIEPETTAPPPPPPAENKSGFIPLVFGGLIAGAIGYAIPTFMQADTPDAMAAVEAVGARVASVEGTLAGMDGLGGQIEAVATDVAAIAVPDIAPLEAGLSGLNEQLAAMEARIAALEARPVGDSGVTAGEIAALSASLEEQMAQSAALTAEIERMAAMQAEGLANAETEALNAARAAKEAAALQVVATALATGEPFEAVVAEVPSLPEALTSVASEGVPTAESLQDSFPDLARSALSVARAGTAETSAEGMFAFIQKQVNARSVAPREGDDPDAVLSRVGAAVEAGDFTAAISELQALPPEALSVLAEWQAAAQIRADAQTALSDFLATN